MAGRLLIILLSALYCYNFSHRWRCWARKTQSSFIGMCIDIFDYILVIHKQTKLCPPVINIKHKHSLQQYLLRGELLRSLRMLFGNASSRSGASRRSRFSPGSPALGHVMYFNTNGSAYQVFDCNVETHDTLIPSKV